MGERIKLLASFLSDGTVYECEVHLHWHLKSGGTCIFSERTNRIAGEDCFAAMKDKARDAMRVAVKTLRATGYLYPIYTRITTQVTEYEVGEA